jgi:type IV pilus assembly protein PilA
VAALAVKAFNLDQMGLAPRTAHGDSIMRKQNGFSLIELLIVVAIILIIAAIAIPSLLRARMSANESSAVGSLRTINTAMVTYNTTYPTVGFAANLLSLGGPALAVCTPSSTSACLIDNVLSSGSKSGYSFTATGSGGPPANTYYATGVPLTVNETGTRSFCSNSDAVVRAQPTGGAITSIAACQVLSPI